MRNRTDLMMLLLACFLNGSISCLRANPISAETARQGVLSHLTSGKALRAKGNIHLTLAYTLDDPKISDHSLLYAFNISDDKGFVIASADDQAEPILGYCDHGNFDPTNIPPNVEDWMKGWAKEIAWLQENGQPSTVETTPKKAKSSISPMLRSTWGQNKPFNNQCVFDGRICAAGCVAVSLAQMIYYWASVGKGGQYFRNGCTALPTYKTKTGRYTVDALKALSTFSWSDMTDEAPKTGTEKSAVAQLIRYSGQSIETDYKEDYSMAYIASVENALKHCFGFNFGLSMIYAKDMTTTQWSERIYEELKAGRPVMMSGSQQNESHAFICDGYDSSGRFHFNWGWAGYCDGWFAMNAINVLSYTLNSNKKAIVNIQPLAKSAYALVSTDATTLTFYYDAKRNTRIGTAYELNVGTENPGWKQNTTIKKVVFDKSFASYYPTTTYGWFCDQAKLTTLTGLANLNMSKVTSAERMFSGCSSLASIDLSILNIPDATDKTYMFYGCSSLTSVSLPSHFTSVNQHMFEGCSSLTVAEIPSSVTSINNYAFYNCSKLTSVTVDLITPPTISSNVFTNRKNADLYIPAGFKKRYANASYWKEFKNMIEYGFAPGDANHDGHVNVADVMVIVNSILGNKDILIFAKESDYNFDGKIDVTDAMSVMDTILVDNSKE